MMVSSVLLEQSDVVTPVTVKITDVSEKMKNNETFQSSPFFTHQLGYRVCLLVIMNGMDERSQVAANISILSGPNDAKLPWPLRGKFTVSILNQVKNSTHHTQALGVHFKTGNTDSASPHAAVEYSCKSLISHAVLFAVSSARKYNINDTIYIQVKFQDFYS